MLRKPFIRRVLIAMSGVLLLSGMFAPQAYAQWPKKPIKNYVGFAAGGGTDTYARILSSLIHEQLGQPMVVINKPGAAGMIALKHVSEQKADGYTVLTLGVGNPITKEIAGKSPVNFRQDMIPIATLGIVPTILTVPIDSPFNTAKEFIDHARANPGTLRWAHAGRGGIHHMMFSGVLKELSIELVDVPFKGGAKTKAAVVASQVDAALMNIQHYAGFESKFKVLAVLSADRDKDEPELPTLKEQGYDVSDIRSPFGVYVMKGTPDDVVTILRGAVKAVIDGKGYKRLLKKSGLKDNYLGPDDSTVFVENMYKQLSQ